MDKTNMYLGGGDPPPPPNTHKHTHISGFTTQPHWIIGLGNSNIYHQQID